MVDLFLEYIKGITTNAAGVFLISFLSSEWCFSYFGKLLINKPYFRFKEVGLFSLLNGVLITVLSMYIGRTRPLFTLIAVPSVIIIELMLMSRDKPFTYVYCWIKSLSNFICIYWLAASLIGFFSPQNVVADILLPVTILLSGSWCLYLSKSARYPDKELRIMIHNRQVGVFHFVFLTVCVVSLSFSTLVLEPILTQDLVSMGRVQHIFFMEMLLKTSLVFVSGYLILFMKALEIRERENVRILSLSLEREEDFRRSTWQEAFLSFYVNLSANQIREGRDYFSAFIWEDVSNYAEVFQKMMIFCVHPSEWTEFSNINKISTIERRLDEQLNAVRQKLRVNPKEMIHLFNLPDQVKEFYDKTEEKWVWIEVKYVYTRDSRSQQICAYISISDIHEEQKRSESLMRDATTDKMTGIYNRASLQSQIEARISSGVEKQAAAGTMILLDLDYFKSINDLLGHPVGDQALMTVARTLKEIFRSTDIVGRLGGDEFCVFMNGVSDEEVIRKRLSEINEKCRKDYPVKEGKTIHLSVSIGAVVCTPEITSYEELYQCADQALYHTKEKGKNSYTLYSELQ